MIVNQFKNLFKFFLNFKKNSIWEEVERNGKWNLINWWLLDLLKQYENETIYK